ncbi:MAG: ribosome-associated translation inhibitor RaiA [Dehalococcoidales bacterium]|nr:ribosome-associated translation inhibitor RaiA [Dehalococcoidales bacterium]
MELHITGTNTELTPRAHSYIKQKLTKLSKHLPDIMSIKAEIVEEPTKSKQQRYVLKATVTSGIGKAQFHADERAEDLFKATDRAAAVLTRQLEKHKGKIYRSGRRNPFARGKFLQPKAETPGKVVKTKHFVIEPMLLEEAITHMESLGHDFFLFFDANASEVRLLYRRNDGDYGLIEPEFKS